MKLLCKLFGHKYNIPSTGKFGYMLCSRCHCIDSKIGWQRIDDFDRSELDESENVFGEE